MRGKLPYFTHIGVHVRLIPAHAGKTEDPETGEVKERAHPRACGENKERMEFNGGEKGSSPRMRGKHTDENGGRMLWGLIPAHAGKTLHSGACVSWSSAHPRACGENLRDDLDALGAKGSSPRMRGKQRVISPVADNRRLIPAHAGKTFPTALKWRRHAAHPRACGENPIACF